MSILVFTDNPGTGETGLVRRECRERGLEVDYLAPWDIHLPSFDPDYDLCYVPSNMLHRGSSSEFVHRLLILRRIEERAIVINPVDAMLYYSKEHFTLQLNKQGIPHPETIITESIEAAAAFAARHLDEGQGVVLKPICRGRGVGVVRLSEIRSRDDLTQYLLWYARNYGEGIFYLQEFVPNKGYDVRCFVIDGEVVGREARINPGDFRYNVAVGGRAEPFEDDSYDELAVKVAETMGFSITGVDILPQIDGLPIVLEANCYPGYKALMKTTGMQVHKLITDYFFKLLKK